MSWLKELEGKELRGALIVALGKKRKIVDRISSSSYGYSSKGEIDLTIFMERELFVSFQSANWRLEMVGGAYFLVRTSLEAPTGRNTRPPRDIDFYFIVPPASKSKKVRADQFLGRKTPELPVQICFTEEEIMEASERYFRGIPQSMR